MPPASQSLTDSDASEEEEVEEEVEEEEEIEEEEEVEEEEEIEEEVKDAVDVFSAGGISDEEDVEDRKGDGAKGVGNGELLIGHDNVSLICKTDSKEFTSDQQTAPLEAPRDHDIDWRSKLNRDEKGPKIVDNKRNNGTSDVCLHIEKDASNLHNVIGSSAMYEKTGTRRSMSRSPTADVALETDSKRPAIACSFFAKGWCIKGNSCRFLHPKDRTEEIAGHKKEIGNRSSRELLVSRTANNLKPETDILVQKALIRTYGDEKQGEKYTRIRMNNQHHIPSLNGKSYSTLNSSFEGNAAYRDVTSGSTERKLYNEMSHSDYLSGGCSSRSQLPMGSPIPCHSFSSSNISIGPGMHDPLSNEKFTADRSLIRQWNSSKSSIPYKVDTASGPAHASSFHQRASLIQTFPQQANSYTHEYGPFGNLSLDRNSVTAFDKGYFSQSCSLPRSHSSVNSPDSLVSFGNKTQSSNSWEPSLPFRSSFTHSSSTISSPGCQYDPLIDSIEPLRVDSQSPPAGFKAGCSASRGSHSPAYNIRIGSSRNNFGYEMSLSGSEIGLIGGVSNGHIFSEEKSCSPYAIDGEILKHAVKNQDDGERQTKEPKVLKIFRGALVEFVKDLLKPFWRGGHLSKDAHKKIVKKVEEKVIGSLQSHQIPSNLESANQYLSSCRPKLEKLVEGYVEKYKS